MELHIKNGEKFRGRERRPGDLAQAAVAADAVSRDGVGSPVPCIDEFAVGVQA